MQKWILPTISEVLAACESTSSNCPNSNQENTASLENSRGSEMIVERYLTQNTNKRIKAEQEWWSAIASVEQLLLQNINYDLSSFTNDHVFPTQGLVFVGPVPVLSHKLLLTSLQSWLFTLESLASKIGTPFQLPPATAQSSSSPAELFPNAGTVLPLVPEDPLLTQQFCLVLTTKFNLVMGLGEDSRGTPRFQFSFDPDVVEQAWGCLRSRIVLNSPQFPISQLDALVKQYCPVAPDYQTVMQFSRLLLKHLPEPELAPQKSKPAEKHDPLSTLSSLRPDVELLQAFAHEVRTPLTTIRTLTRLLLKRQDLDPNVTKRLEIIDHECTEQIERMELLFRAAELEISTVKNHSAHLTSMSLAQVLQQSIPRWQKQASLRNLTLNVVLPQQLPTVVSDPKMLERVLTSLIDNFTRSLPAGSHIQVQVIPAGDQLKLQLLHQSQPLEGVTAEETPTPPMRKSLGNLLIFQPETGTISLNLTATKHLFQAIGGKLIVRQRPQQGEVMTIFLPLDVSCTEFCS